jgi:hypothetical protein
MQCEECERQLDDHDSDLSAPEDSFIAEGLSSSDNSDIALPLKSIPLLTVSKLEKLIGRI